MKRLIPYTLALLSFFIATEILSSGERLNDKRVTINNHNENKPYISVIVNNNLALLLEFIKTHFNKEQITEDIKKRAHTLFGFGLEFTKLHKRNLIIGTITGSYCFIVSSLLYMGYKILQRTTWSCWKDHIPYDIFQVIPHQELGRELLYAIQQRYQTSQNLTDFLTPLISFLHDVDYELALIKHFLKIHIWLKTFRLSTMFPHQEDLIQKAEEKRQRLIYLREVFMYWVTDYKITINAPQAS
jgi:hypothetical protein